jgi:hypothetical protein
MKARKGRRDRKGTTCQKVLIPILPFTESWFYWYIYLNFWFRRTKFHFQLSCSARLIQLILLLFLFVSLLILRAFSPVLYWSEKHSHLQLFAPECIPRVGFFVNLDQG